MVIEWQESAEELYKQFKREKEQQRRTRLQAMYLLRTGKLEREAAEICGVNERTIRRWVKWYREAGLSSLLERLNGGKRGNHKRLTDEQEEQLRAEIDTGRFHTAKEIVAWVAEKWQVEYREKSIYDVLKRLKINKKVPRKQSDKADPAQQEAWKKGG